MGLRITGRGAGPGPPEALRAGPRLWCLHGNAAGAEGASGRAVWGAPGLGWGSRFHREARPGHRAAQPLRGWGLHF